MNNICLILFGLILVCDVFANQNEWYCKVADDKYQICRKCIDLNEDCDKEPRTECKCENWKFTNSNCKYVLHIIKAKEGSKQGQLNHWAEWAFA